MHSMPLERRHNVKRRQDNEGANMSTMVVRLNNKGVACLEGSRGQAPTRGWLAWKVHEVKLTAGANHSNANKDRHRSVVNEGQTSQNSYQ
jgi:hypothetical protein